MQLVVFSPARGGVCLTSKHYGRDAATGLVARQGQSAFGKGFACYLAAMQQMGLSPDKGTCVHGEDIWLGAMWLQDCVHGALREHGLS